MKKFLISAICMLFIISCSENKGDTENKDNEYPYPSLCTSITKCYDNSSEINCPSEGEAFYGQDAQYTNLCIPVSYNVSGVEPEKIVTDNNTGLHWQKTASDESFKWDNAMSHCKELDYGGYADWRLPSVKELLSILNHKESHPAIDINYFPDTKPESYWTSTSYAGNIDKAWNVIFRNNGSSQYLDKTDYSYTKQYARCVRGEKWNPGNEFTKIDISEKIVLKDLQSGLFWTKEYSNNSMTWEDALAYCENLEYADFTDWRLPNINELITLVDYSSDLPASSFPGMTNNIFWSSSSSSDRIQSAKSLNFTHGDKTSPPKTYKAFVICAR
ncbi:MAG: DUF1566 domain-containing protein [bacterium]